MVALVKKIIEAERASDWEKHLYTITLMSPYLHSSGHFHYAVMPHLSTVYVKTGKNNGHRIQKFC